jgi:uncharacterized protein
MFYWLAVLVDCIGGSEEMSREYPDWLDPWKAAEGRRRFSGSMALARMKRLQPLLADDSGETRFSVGFEFDRQRRVTINIKVEATLMLICQSSLEPYPEQVDRRSLLGVIESLTEEEEIPDDYESVLVEERNLSMLALVEDELLLGVPQVPRNPQLKQTHVQSETVMSGKGAQDKDLRKPFAGLAEQMKKLDQKK